MSNFESFLQELERPGSHLRRLLLGGLFLLLGLLFVCLGFWKTLLVAALTALGYAIGSSANLMDSLKKLINRVIPTGNQTVTYSAEDIQKVQQALEKKEKAAPAPAEEKK